MAGPIQQFEIKPLFRVAEIAGREIHFTNSAAYMFLAVAGSCLFLLLATRRRRVVPGRWQSAAEMLHEFVAKTLRENAGEQGMRFFPLVFSLFMFVLAANLIGMFPYAFTVTSHLIITFSLAMIVFLTVTIYGVVRHGFGFFRLFMPAGIPLALAPIIVPIELISYLSRPVSHSVRLFAVMLAGHITLKVFAGFVAALGGLGVLGILAAVLPLAMTVALTGLELLMSVIQAYIFTMLTCMYLNDAIHPGH
ncbi:F0F1 ATP synthase subunit A [Phreatobacter stygius]|uniref:ATP synthase subunit a n=1 Tax=Phreatobacter stygius TaxID=1940610 RepID=A0A4D7B897_9HYPH|nr:F0F1 ATP synthase subunit A [Phreatobacter stygius]QCI66518.1 F0F1 ATP synthase subunit A [Phreatobacter stygius]